MKTLESFEGEFWDLTWCWYPCKKTNAELLALIRECGIVCQQTLKEISNDYVNCHRVLMEMGNVDQIGTASFVESARNRTLRWGPMLLQQWGYLDFSFPAVSCQEFLSIDLRTIKKEQRVELTKKLSIQLTIPPEWSWSQNHRIWWCVDGASTERLDDFLNDTFL